MANLKHKIFFKIKNLPDPVIDPTQLWTFDSILIKFDSVKATMDGKVTL